MPVPVVPLALGAAALLLLTRKSEGAYSQAPADGSAPAVKEKAPPAKTWKEMPPALQEQVAAALGALGVSPATGELSGSGVTADAIKMATQTAALCESQGFYDIAQQLRGYIAKAAPTVPTPVEAAPIAKAAPPGLTPEQVTALSRTLTLDRDPKAIQATIEMLQKLPPSPQRDSLLEMARALLLQLAAAQSTTQTMQQIDQVIKSPGIAEVHAAVQPLPPVVVPVTPPPPPPPPPSVPRPSPAPAVVPPAAVSVPAPANAPAAQVTPAAVDYGALSMAQLRSLTGTRLLKKGVPAGTDIKAWQQVLRNDGFSNVVVDGIYGDITTSATKSWQKQRGLTADGQVGPKTRALIGVNPKVATPAAPAATAPVATVPAATVGPKLSFAEVKDPTPGAAVLGAGRSMSKDAVKSWQNILIALGYGSLVGTPDGIWGAKTTAATVALQTYAKAHYKDTTPIGTDGAVGPQTRRIVVARTAELKGSIVAGRRRRRAA